MEIKYCKVTNERCKYLSYQDDRNMAICFCCHPLNKNKYEGNCTVLLCPLKKEKKERNMKHPMVVTHCPNCGSKDITLCLKIPMGRIMRCLNCLCPDFIVLTYPNIPIE